MARLLHSALGYLHDSGRTAKAKCQNLIDFLQDSWLLEIGACVVALGLFVAEILLLRFFEKPAWRTTSLAAHAISFSCYAADDCQGSLVESMSSSFSNLTAFMSNVIRKTPGAGPQYSYGTSSNTVLIYDLR